MLLWLSKLVSVLYDAVQEGLSILYKAPRESLAIFEDFLLLLLQNIPLHKHPAWHCVSLTLSDGGQ